jgi:hypothetical protein
MRQNIIVTLVCRRSSSECHLFLFKPHQPTDKSPPPTPFPLPRHAQNNRPSFLLSIVDGNVVKTRDLDNVFAAVNAVVRSGAPERKNKDEKSHNTSKSIVRYEFLEAVVRLGLRRFPAETQVRAVQRVCEEHILPAVDPFWNLDDFRRNHLYLEDTHLVLQDERFEKRLRELYDEGVHRAAMNDRNVKLLDTTGFVEIMVIKPEDEIQMDGIKGMKNKLQAATGSGGASKMAQEAAKKEIAAQKKQEDDAKKMLGGKDALSKVYVSEKHALLAFAQSQMTTVDEEDRSASDARRDAADFSTYTEYLEAIVRLANMVMTGIDNEMLNTPQKVERFLATVLFPDIGAPEKPFGSDRGGQAGEGAAGGGAEEVTMEDVMSPGKKKGKKGKKGKKKKKKKKKSKKGNKK